MVVLGGAAGAATLYRYAPNHATARWVWLTPGSLAAAALWLLLTIGFGIYVANFGNYNATYGSLGAVAVTLTWLYLSGYVLLLGAELNAELERRAKREANADPQPVPWTDTASDGRPTSQDAAAMSASAVVAVHPVPPTPAILQELGLWRASRRARRAIVLDKIELAPSLIATGGLALLRRREKTVLGFALLTASELIALLNSPPPKHPDDTPY